MPRLSRVSLETRPRPEPSEGEAPPSARSRSRSGSLYLRPGQLSVRQWTGLQSDGASARPEPLCAVDCASPQPGPARNTVLRLGRRGEVRGVLPPPSPRAADTGGATTVLTAQHLSSTAGGPSPSRLSSDWGEVFSQNLLAAG